MADLEIPKLEGSRVRLEPLSTRHSAGMFALWSAREVCEHSGPAADFAGEEIPLPAGSRAESDRLLEFWLRRAVLGTGFRWAVILEAQNEFVGAVGFNSLGSCSEYAYHFVPGSWGAGLATEASRLAISWGLGHEAESIEAFISAENTRSLRLAERLGFRSTGEESEGAMRHVLHAASVPRKGAA